MKLTVLIAFALLVPALAAAQQRRSAEREPNDLVANATVAALGDTLVGEITTEQDVDYFVIDVPAGTILRMKRTQGDVNVCLVDLDHITRLGCFRNYVETGYFNYQLTAPGRYLMRMSASYPEADAIEIGPYGVAIDVESFPLGSGDPPRTVAELTARGWSQYALAAGFEGETYVQLPGPEAIILRLDRSGTVSEFASGLNLSRGMVMDAFGNLLVSGPENGEHTIWSISPTHVITKFADHLGTFYNYDGFPLAIGPDGDVWAGEVRTIWRYSPTGQLRATTSAPNCGFNSIAISPGGVLHINGYASGCRGVFAFPATGMTEIARDTVGDMAFDRDGNLYVGVSDDGDYPNVRYGHVTVFNTAYQVTGQVAHVPGVNGLIFLRDEQGRMTSRIFTSQLGILRIVELNGAEGRVPGWGPPRFYRADPVALSQATVGSFYQDTLELPGVSGALQWTIETGTLPRGISLSSAGVLQGIPMDPGTFGVSLRAGRESEAWYGDAVIRVAPLTLSAVQIADAIMGGQTLSPELVEYLDALGNKNGSLDAGDLRAYLRSQGLLRTTKRP